VFQKLVFLNNIQPVASYVTSNTERICVLG